MHIIFTQFFEGCDVQWSFSKNQVEGSVYRKLETAPRNLWIADQTKHRAKKWKWQLLLHRRKMALAKHIFTFTYSLTAGVVGAPQMTSQPVSSILLSSPLPSGICQTPGLSIPSCYLPTSFFLFLSALSSSPFHCALQAGFGQTWWTGDMAISLKHICFSANFNTINKLKK